MAGIPELLLNFQKRQLYNLIGFVKKTDETIDLAPTHRSREVYIEFQEILRHKIGGRIHGLYAGGVGRDPVGDVEADRDLPGPESGRENLRAYAASVQDGLITKTRQEREPRLENQSSLLHRVVSK